MTEEPPSDRITPEPVGSPQPEAPHEDAVPEAFPSAVAPPSADSTTRKADTMRDEIRAGWCRALRRG